MQYCSEACSNSGVPLKSIISSIKRISNLMWDTVNYLKGETMKFINQSVDHTDEQTKTFIEKFDYCGELFSKFDSKYKILTTLKENGCFVNPTKIVLGSRYEQKLDKNGVPCQILRKETFQYISIGLMIKQIISVDGFINMFENYKCNKSIRGTTLNSIHDGFYYYSNPVLSSMDTIAIESYI